MTNRAQSINPMLFVSGLVIGTVVTALFTPKTGPEIRKQLKQNADRASENVKSNANKAKEQAQSAREKAAAKLSKRNDNNSDKPDQPPLPPTA